MTALSRTKAGAFRRARKRLRALWDARELLRNMVVRDIKVRYKNSVLGFGWSMVTPLVMVVVFTFIFTRVFQTGLPDFPVFFLAGFLSWQYFSNAVTGSTGAIVSNGNLIKKVYFPREVLPLATVVSQAVHFLLSMLVFAVYALIEGYNFLPLFHWFVLAVVLQTLFVSGLAMLFAAANVGFRDLQELQGVIFLLWFYGTPIIYELDMVPARYQAVLELNPMTHFVALYRHAMYYLSAPSGRVIAACAISAVVSLAFGYALFTRLAVSFAKEV